MKTQDHQISFVGHPVFVGLDVHKNSWQVTIMPQGVVHKTFHMAPGSPVKLKEHLHQQYPGGNYTCAYEAGFSGFWIQEELTRLGITTVVFHAGDIPTTDKEKRQKTDTRDSIKIAKALLKGDCEPIYVPDKEWQYMRSFVRQRWRIVVDRQRIMHRIKTHLYYYGIVADEVTWRQDWSGKHIQWLEKVAKERNDFTLNVMLAELALKRRMERDILVQMRSLFKAPKYQNTLRLLLSVPGVGFISSAVILTEIGLDFSRFGTFDRLCAYCGLMPDTKSSGDAQRVGDLTHRGNGRLRTTLIECAWAAIYRDMELRLCYESYKKRMPAQKAIVKITRKLLSRIRRVIIYKEKYQPALAV